MVESWPSGTVIVEASVPASVVKVTRVPPAGAAMSSETVNVTVPFTAAEEAALTKEARVGNVAAVCA